LNSRSYPHCVVSLAKMQLSIALELER